LRYGFVIDHNRCIGCHACTVACKEENDVPVGVFRTWVKYIEKGEFPNPSRHFGVMRCNHCEAAPCVEICPTQALFHRPDGIVDFDNSRCIGCKSCMQACPYDALYLDPRTHTAAKCNFCAHRIERNLEPACVIVCPTQAIIAGDIDNPDSQAGRMVASGKLGVRKPHKATQPKLFYSGIEGDFLDPSMMTPQSSYLWSERPPDGNPYAVAPPSAKSKPAPGAARVVYDVAHQRPWGLIPVFYLWTKAIAAGLIIIAAFVMGIDPELAASRGPLLNEFAPLAAIVFLAITTALLIADLDRPERFYFILIKPNPRSWLVRGTWILMLFGALAAAWLGYAVIWRAPAPAALRWAAAAAGAGSACYSAFLFAQGRGRDLWQNSSFLWILLAQAVVAGAAAMILLAILASSPAMRHAGAMAYPGFVRKMDVVMLIGVSFNAAIAIGIVMLPQYTADARKAIELIRSGRLRSSFWYGVIGAGNLMPALLAAFLIWHGASDRGLDRLTAILALLGVLVFDEIWILAGQAAPLS
jgi:Fe-S-cluster-containing dehydrogenase component/formate-dependent nitrite reductase membrane component NrfD